MKLLDLLDRDSFIHDRIKYTKMKKLFYENRYRSVVKALTFRSLIICSDMTIILAITHRFDEAFNVMLFSNVASTLLYIIHERIWNNIHWGKHHKIRT
jgi:adenylylsulfate kinase